MKTAITLLIGAAMTMAAQTFLVPPRPAFALPSMAPAHLKTPVLMSMDCVLNFEAGEEPDITKCRITGLKPIKKKGDNRDQDGEQNSN